MIPTVSGRMTVSCEREALYSLYSPPLGAVALRQGDRGIDLFDGLVDGAGQVAALDRELHADKARIVLAVDEGRAVGDLDLGELLERDLLAARRRHQDIADLFGRAAVLRRQADDEVELLFLLHDLCGDVAADRRLDDAVDVVDIEAVARDGVAVDLDGQARLSQFLDECDVMDATYLRKDVLDGLALLLERAEVAAEHLHRQRAL